MHPASAAAAIVAATAADHLEQIIRES